MTAYQKLIRDLHAQEPDPLLPEKLRLARSLSNATVREISHKTAQEIILKYEWLGNMGCTDYSFGLYFGDYLAGAACFGRTAGTKVAGSVCGKQYAHMVRTLCRGACVHWAHPHSASFLISHALRLMSEKGFHIFVAYSDSDAGEIGTVYQATNWLYCGTKNGSSMFVWAKSPKNERFKDGKARDERNIHHFIRSRRFKGSGITPYTIKCTRREARAQMVRDGFLFYKSAPKGRYVTFVGERDLVRKLRTALTWDVLPYPKRKVAA